MSNFKIGEKVVCIDDSIRSNGNIRIKKGDIYTISSFENCCSNNFQLKEISNIGIKKCIKCGNSVYSNSYLSSRFRKLDYSFGEKICAEILESVKVKQEQLN